MLDGYLAIEHGQVSLGGKLIPGIFVSQSIRGAVRFDEAKADNLSGKVKTPLGWEDADISIELDLLTEDGSTCYEKLSRLNALFKGYDNGSNPKVYSLVNPHIIARGIDQVVFSGLDSSESDDDDVIRARLSFVEHNPPVIEVEKRVAASNEKTNETPTVADNVEADPTLTQDKTNPFHDGFKAGTA
jgi:uncharacterized protein YfaP (DUF2135 family)